MSKSGLIQFKGVANDLSIGLLYAETGISSGQEAFGGMEPGGKGRENRMEEKSPFVRNL